MKKKKAFIIFVLFMIMILSSIIVFGMHHELEIKKQPTSQKVSKEKLKDIPNDVPNKEVDTKDSQKIKQPKIKKEEKAQENKKPTTPVITPPQHKQDNTLPKDTPTEPVQKPSSKPNDENDIFRQSIENKYGITIKYGNEFNDYRPNRFIPNYLTDKNEIKEALNTVNQALSYYPTDFFKEIKMAGMPVTFFLVKSIPDNGFSGLTDREFMDRIIITLTTNGFLFRVIHHEIMHYIDAYLEIKMYPNTPYTDWIKLNPEDFTYGSPNKTYVYHMLNNKYGTYFINNYAQTNSHEDRASTFEDMMASAYAKEGIYDVASPIRNKAQLITDQIKRYLTSANSASNLRWERFL